MKMSPFSAPFFWGTQKRRLLLPRRATALWEGTQWCKGGTGKAEAAKLQDAGISLKQCPEKVSGRKRLPTVFSNNENEEPDPVVSDAKNGLKAQSRAGAAWLEK
jgi:hypothetical protein